MLIIIIQNLDRFHIYKITDDDDDDILYFVAENRDTEYKLIICVIM